MVRQNPAKERGPRPANGRGVYKNSKTPMRDCKGCPGSPTQHIIRDVSNQHIISEGKQTMSERIVVPIPMSSTATKVQVYYQGELNRHGGVEPGRTEASIKLPAPLEDCEIRVIPCDLLGEPLGRGYIYKDGSLVPEGAEMDAPKVDPDVVATADEALVVVERAEASVDAEEAAEEAEEAAEEEARDEEEDYLDALKEEYGNDDDDEKEEYEEEDDDDDGETLVPA